MMDSHCLQDGPAVTGSPPRLGRVLGAPTAIMHSHFLHCGSCKASQTWRPSKGLSAFLDCVLLISSRLQLSLQHDQRRGLGQFGNYVQYFAGPVRLFQVLENE